jgi:hypothetical protein
MASRKTNVKIVEKRYSTLQEVVEKAKLSLPKEEDIIDKLNSMLTINGLEEGYVSDLIYDSFEDTLEEDMRECIYTWIYENFKLQLVRK